MTLRVGIIGCGKIADGHAQGYLARPDLAEIVVCSDDWSEEAARKMAENVGGADVANSWETVVARPDVDVVSICMPHYLHLPIAKAAAKAGKHILVEKPMALNVEEAKQMVAAADEAGTLIMTGQNQRFMSEHLVIKDLLDRDAIGRIVAVRFDCNQFLRNMYPEGSWMFSKEKTGGGMVICTAVHKIDLLRYFFGEVSRVSSFQARTGLNYNMDNEDVAALLLEFESGIIGEGFYLFAAYKVPIPTATNELTIIYGDKGVIHNVGGWHVYSTEIPEYSGGQTKLDLPRPAYRESITAEISHFLECIHDGKEPLTSGRDNLGTMAVIDAVYRSAEHGTVEDVTW